MKLFLSFKTDAYFEDHKCMYDSQPLIIHNSIVQIKKWLNSQSVHDSVLVLECTLNRLVNYDGKQYTLYREDCLFNPSFSHQHRQGHSQRQVFVRQPSSFGGDKLCNDSQTPQLHVFPYKTIQPELPTTNTSTIN